jgi:hypothetical protein
LQVPLSQTHPFTLLQIPPVKKIEQFDMGRQVFTPFTLTNTQLVSAVHADSALTSHSEVGDAVGVLVGFLVGFFVGGGVLGRGDGISLGWTLGSDEVEGEELGSVEGV